MKQILAIMAVATMAGAFIGAASISNLASASDGKSVFKDNKCDKCHTMESQGIDRNGAAPPGKQPPDLSGVGLKHNADWIKGWLLKTEEQNGKKHLKKWTGSDDELATITKWLAAQKKK
jgi:cytochrome c2